MQARENDRYVIEFALMRKMRAQRSFHVTKQHVNWLAFLTSITLYSERHHQEESFNHHGID